MHRIYSLTRKLLVRFGVRHRFHAAAMSMVVVLLLFSVGGALAGEPNDYEKHTWATFHHLFDHHSFRPFLSCQGKAARCKELLTKIANGDFQFLRPIGHGDTPHLPALTAMRRHCPDVGVVHLQYLSTPLKPTSGFALYLVPAELSPRRDEKVYLSRSEDYRDQQGIKADGAFSVFTYPGCKRLNEITFEKTHKSAYSPNEPNQETASLAEPIIIAGKVLLMIIYAYNEGVPKESPLYSMVLWSITGNARSGGELYSFSGH